MLEPAPTTKIDPTLTRGTIAEVRAATATKPACVVLTVPNTDYRIELRPVGADGGEDLTAFEGRVGRAVIGRIRAGAKRIDRVGAGGRFVEPCFGRPRRVQGMVRAIEGGAVVVSAGQGLVLHLSATAPGQGAGMFAPDDFVTCGVLDGASFELVE